MTTTNAAVVDREHATERTPLKIELALELLLEADRAERYICALDALSAFGDSAWHSTIHDLRKKGLAFLQRPYRHRHRHGGTARFVAYRLDPACVDEAEALLAGYQLAGGHHA